MIIVVAIVIILLILLHYYSPDVCQLLCTSLWAKHTHSHTYTIHLQKTMCVGWMTEDV